MTDRSSRTDHNEYRVVTKDGDPALKLPNGDTVRLKIFVTEWTHEEPQFGEPVGMKAEVDSDDFAWWTLYPERSEVVGPNTDEDFPQVSIEPEIEEDGSA